MVRILLTRHGHVEGISPPRFRGRLDLPLTELGRAQAARLAERIAGAWSPALIYSSPLQRCLDTARAVAELTGASIEPVDALQDLDYGAWQGEPHEVARAQNPKLFDLWFAAPQLVRFPKGETLQELVARSADALRLVLGRSSHETVVMVGHDSVNRALLLQLLDQPLSAYWRLDQGPCALSEASIDGHVITVHRINETAHLSGLA